MDSGSTVILLVEDNPDDEAMTLEALKSNGLGNSVVVARDGAEALDYLYGKGVHAGRDASVVPAVVLLDLKLPKVDGLRVLTRIRSEEATRTLPVVVLTSSDEQKDLVESYSLGVNGYVRKPVEFSELVEAVRQLGIYWSSIRHDRPR